MSKDPEIRSHQWKAIRRAILVRDNYTCYVCLGRANSVDHIVPRNMGGTNHFDNLRACCTRCNSGKGNRAPAVPITSRVW
jgi:5-methylcytosine-specific restriction endonuclease McrA